MAHAEELHEAGEHSVEVELHEVFLVALTDAIIDPWTVMVHLEDINSQCSAVMRSLWLPCLFLSLPLITVLYLLSQVTVYRCFHSFFDYSRIGRHTSYVSYDLHRVESITSHEQYEALVF